MQTMMGMPKNKAEHRVIVKLYQDDLTALEKGMGMVGEKNKSSYIRRLIHEGKNRKV